MNAATLRSYTAAERPATVQLAHPTCVGDPSSGLTSVAAHVKVCAAGVQQPPHLAAALRQPVLNVHFVGLWQGERGGETS